MTCPCFDRECDTLGFEIPDCDLCAFLEAEVTWPTSPPCPQPQSGQLQEKRRDQPQQDLVWQSWLENNPAIRPLPKEALEEAVALAPAGIPTPFRLGVYMRVTGAYGALVDHPGVYAELLKQVKGSPDAPVLVRRLTAAGVAVRPNRESLSSREP